MYKFRIFLSILFLLGGLASCKKEQPTQDKLLQRKWQFKSITQNGKEIKKISPSDAMILNGEGVFEYEILQEKIEAKGTWKLINDTLTYSYLPKNDTALVDSVAYFSLDGKPIVTYYTQGKELASLTNEGLKANQLQRKYKVDTLTASSLVLSENGVIYSFSYKPTVKVAGKFDINNFMNGLIGIFGLTVIGFMLSNNRRRINWMLIIKALIIQMAFAFLILRVQGFADIFSQIASGFVTLLEFTRKGSTFLFGGLVSNTQSFGFIFVFQVLPTIIFFAALTSMLFYLNILQRVVYGVAWVMKRLMSLSGAESLASAANIFIGQTEAPLVIKPYIPKMTRSETMALMTGGMAHISGGVLAAYIGFLGGNDPEEQRLFATHLLSASIMTAPGTFFAAKLMIPETEEFSKELNINREKIGSNILDAIANGTTDGLKLAVNVAAMLLVFIAFITMFNYMIKNWIGELTGLNTIILNATNGEVTGLSLEYLLGWVFAPIAWLIGIRGEDVSMVGQLLGTKVILNEFVAYIKFSEIKELFASQRNIIITTYALCGFANFASIGIQLGGIGSLAPEKRPMLASLGVKALIGGTIANLLSAAIAGMLV